MLIRIKKYSVCSCVIVVVNLYYHSWVKIKLNHNDKELYTEMQGYYIYYVCYVVCIIL